MTTNTEKIPRPKVRMLNKKHTVEFILAYCAKNRPKFRRVSLDFLLRMEARLKGRVLPAPGERNDPQVIQKQKT